MTTCKLVVVKLGGLLLENQEPVADFIAFTLARL
jgi:hypothetical protein